MKDIQIRFSLHNEHLTSFYEDGVSLVLDEMPICSGLSIADLAVVNGSLHAFEIKGTFDSLARLQKQVANYSKVFDFITIVTTQNHLNQTLSFLPTYCGIWLMEESAEKKIKKKVIRRAKRNKLVDPMAVCQLLWRDEAYGLLMKYKLERGMKSKSKVHLWERLSHSLPQSILSQEIRSIIKQRVDWKLSKFRVGDLNQADNLSDMVI